MTTLQKAIRALLIDDHALFRESVSEALTEPGFTIEHRRHPGGDPPAGVKAILQALFHKTAVRTRGQLVRVALEQCENDL